MRRLGKTNIDVYPLCLGGNVFGWTADQTESFAVLDAYVEAGGNFIDTADVYGQWLNQPGVSETIIGSWMKARNNRDRVVIATKVGAAAERPGLSAQNIEAACDESLKRLQTDHVDVYFAHRDFADSASLEETLEAFDSLVRAGKVRVVGASNYTPERLEQALKISEQNGWARYEVLQNEYNLMERDYEDAMADVVVSNGLASVPYYALASGFLTGKYRPGGAEVQSVRAEGATKFLQDSRAAGVLEALDAIAATHTTTVAAVALAWLAAQPGVVAPIASGRTAQQVVDILPMARLQLSERELKSLSDASA